MAGRASTRPGRRPSGQARPTAKSAACARDAALRAPAQRVPGASRRARERAHVAHRQPRPAALADAVLVDRAAAAAVLEQHRRPAGGRGVAVAPLHQRDDRRPQVQALLGQAVLVARRVLLVEAPLEHALLEQPREARLQHVARDAEVGLDLVEAAQAQQHVAHDQQRPALADHLERAGDAARSGSRSRFRASSNTL